MNTLNLKNCKVAELSSKELQETNGGSLAKLLVAVAAELFLNGAEYWGAFRRGYTTGNR